MPLEDNRAVAYTTKVPAALSILCSGYIVYSILSNHQKRSSPKERIVLGLSFSTILLSFFMFLTTWPIPHGTEMAYGPVKGTIHGAVGNTKTCSLQGFFIQLGVMTPMYNGLLALYYFLYICRDWRELQMKYVELFGHLFVLCFGLSTAIAALALQLYNSAGNICWISPLPGNCTQSFQSMDGTTNCIRGDNAFIYQFAFFGAMVWVNIFWTFLSMLLVYCHIRKQEKTMESYTSEYSEHSARRAGMSNTNNNNSASREVAIHGILFTSVFLITWVPSTIDRLLSITGNIGNIFLFRTLFLMTPCQGIFNFLVYIRPEVSQYFRDRKRRRAEE